MIYRQAQIPFVRNNNQDAIFHLCLKELQHMVNRSDIEIGGRLIKNQYYRIPHERTNARRRRCPPDQSPPASPIVSFNVIPFFCNIWLIPSARQLASSRTFDILALPSVMLSRTVPANR